VLCPYQSFGHSETRWQFQPQRRDQIRVVTLRQQRQEVLHFLDESPSLKPYLLAAKAKSCQTDLDLTSEKTFPTYKVFKDCPAIYPSSGEDIVAGEFFSGEASALAQSLQAELDGESNS